MVTDVAPAAGTVVPALAGLTAIVMVTEETVMKLAVTVPSAVRVAVVDAAVAFATVAPPDTLHELKLYPELAVADILTASPWFTELEPDGVVAPDPLGLTAMVNAR
jgi:hypothetical protein